MEKFYYISDFKKEYIDIILHNQKELNPNGDNRIEGEEIEKVKAFFKKLNGKDLPELLANYDEKDKQVGVDTVEIADDDDEKTNETKEEIKEEASEKVEISPEEQIANVIQKFKYTAAHELKTVIDSDLAAATPGNTEFSDQIQAYKSASAKAAEKGQINRVADLDQKIEVLKSISEMQKRESDDDTKNVKYKIVKYGNDNNKKGLLFQEFGLNTNSSVKKRSNEADETEVKDENTISEENQESGNQTNTDSINEGSGNKTDVDVNYHLKFITLNPETQGNSNIDLNINAGSDNVDIDATAAYQRVAKNGAIHNMSAIIRETIENNNNVGDYGLTYDYLGKDNKFATGAYVRYHHEEVDGTKEKLLTSEAYAKYANTLRVSLNYEKDYDGIDAFGAKLAIRGKREFPNNGITISGKFEGDYTYGKFTKDRDFEPIRQYGLNATGKLSFKGSKDINADVVGHLFFVNQSVKSHDIQVIQKAIGASVLGKVSTKDFDISAAVSALKTPTKMSYLGTPDDDPSKTSITTSVEIVPKCLLKYMGINDGTEFFVKYTGGTDVSSMGGDAAGGNIGVGVRFTPFKNRDK